MFAISHFRLGAAAFPSGSYPVYAGVDALSQQHVDRPDYLIQVVPAQQEEMTAFGLVLAALR